MSVVVPSSNLEHVELQSLSSGTPSNLLDHSLDTAHNVIQVSQEDSASPVRTNSPTHRTSDGPEIQSDLPPILSDSPNTAIIWARILLTFLCLFIFALSLGYSIANILEVSLKVVTDCPERKSREDIWEHSYQSSIQNGEVIPVINAASQFGISEEACWTSHPVEINTDSIWYSNQYDARWMDTITLRFVLFGLISLVMAIVAFGGLVTLTLDLIAISNGTLHQKSKEYSMYMNSMKTHSIRSVSPAQSPRQNNWRKKCQSVFSFFKHDTATWIGIRILGECTEFLLQSAAFLRYGGYDLFDAGDTPLAEKPGAIIAFASALCFNCIGSGIMWILYALLPGHCFGVNFSRSLFWIDKLSDLLYALFPIYVILSDDYNSDTVTDIKIVLGHLQFNQDGIQFLATIFPLCMLAHRCIWMTMQTTRRMRAAYFARWEAQCELTTHQSTITEGNPVGNECKTIEQHMMSLDSFDKSWIHREQRPEKRRIRQRIVSLIGCSFIIFGAFILCAALFHVAANESYCASVTESTFEGHLPPTKTEKERLEMNPELMVWDHCRYKVYPFTTNELHRCQCRVFVIDSNTDFNLTTIQLEEQFNLTKSMVMNGAMSHWFMAEKFSIEGKGVLEENVDFSPSFQSLSKAVHMRAFSWTHAQVAQLQSDHFDHWKELEFLKIQDTFGISEFYDSFARLSKLRYLELRASDVPDLFPLLCNVTSLEVIWFYGQLLIDELPQCMDELVNLRILVIESSPVLKTFPLSILSLPQLKILSVSRDDISWDGLLEGNLPAGIDRNDTDAVMEWLDEHFKFHNETEYTLLLNPICYENTSFLSSNITEFLQAACAFPPEISEVAFGETLCSAYLLGDGKCDSFCNEVSLLFDMGDCMHLCFADEISNCSLSKLANNQCDAGCHNQYCIGLDALAIAQRDLSYDDTEAMLMETRDGKTYASDSFYCPWNGSLSESEYPSCSEASSESVFIDSNLPSELRTECDPSWIGDTLCDDACRVSDCANDGGDCDMQCTNDFCRVVDQIWTHWSGDEHFLNHTFGCNVVYPLTLTFFGIEDEFNCTEEIQILDFNQDGRMNFREFMVFGALAFHNFQLDPRSFQLNCSDCSGMEYYNA